MYKIKLSLLLVLLIVTVPIFAQQDTDHAYTKSLKQVLSNIEQRFNVKIKYPDSLVENKWVKYADWRFRSDAKTSLDNVLKPLDLKAKQESNNVFKLSGYEYYRWDVEDGWAELDRIAAQYTNLKEWELRKNKLQPELLEALQLSHLPATPNSKPIVTNKRVHNGYSVENIAIEILPGVWINGSLYKPNVIKGKIPLILNPDGHWPKQRYREDCQYRCAGFAKMGSMAFSYDLFAWGESQLQFKLEDHRRSLSMTIQALGSIRILDYLLSLKEVDTSRVGITGGSGAGSHTVLVTALDNRIKASAPVVAISSYFYGGCPCESGMPIHACGNRTDNVEIAAMAAPRPQLLVSDGGDWTDKMPEHDFVYLQKMYGLYNKESLVENVHLVNEKHDFGVNKRMAVYNFFAKTFNLNKTALFQADGKLNESSITIEDEKEMYVFGDHGQYLPSHAIKGFENLEQLFYTSIKVK